MYLFELKLAPVFVRAKAQLRSLFKANKTKRKRGGSATLPVFVRAKAQLRS